MKEEKILKKLDDQIVLKFQPELRHIIAHLYMAIDDLINNCPISALDNLKSIEGLIMFSGDTHKDYENYYKEYLQWLKRRKRKNAKARSVNK